MKKELDIVNSLTLYEIRIALEDFCESEEAKTITSADGLYIYLGYKNYLDLFILLGNSNKEKKEVFGITYELDPTLKAREIQINRYVNARYK